MAKHIVRKIKNIFIRDSKGEISSLADNLYWFEENYVNDIEGLRRNGYEIFAEVEEEQLEVEEDLWYYVGYVDEKLVASQDCRQRWQSGHWTVVAKNEDEAIEAVMEELKND
jgi:hypothetical protein